MPETTGTEESFEIERLRAEIAQEKQMKEMLDQSLQELQMTVDELDKHIETIGDENSEWKTRYETQLEMNQQLQKQALVLQDKVDEAKRTLKEARLPKSVKSEMQDHPEVTPAYLNQLEKDHDALSRQLVDLEWRLDQESKAYHKANEERKQFVLEISVAKETLNNLKARQLQSSYLSPRDLEGTQRVAPNSLTNIPQDHRIIDPKKNSCCEESSTTGMIDEEFLSEPDYFPNSYQVLFIGPESACSEKLLSLLVNIL